jgi:hypothetical protein
MGEERSKMAETSSSHNGTIPNRDEENGKRENNESIARIKTKWKKEDQKGKRSR